MPCEAEGLDIDMFFEGVDYNPLTGQPGNGAVTKLELRRGIKASNGSALVDSRRAQTRARARVRAQMPHCAAP